MLHALDVSFSEEILRQSFVDELPHVIEFDFEDSCTFLAWLEVVYRHVLTLDCALGNPALDSGYHMFTVSLDDQILVIFGDVDK